MLTFLFIGTGTENFVRVIQMIHLIKQNGNIIGKNTRDIGQFVISVRALKKKMKSSDSMKVTRLAINNNGGQYTLMVLVEIYYSFGILLLKSPCLAATVDIERRL